MRKKVFGRKFARNRKSRKALFRGLIYSMVENGQLQTTKAKAKAIQPELEKLITLARKNTESSERLVFARLGNNEEVTKKLVKTYLPKFGTRNSGFTRIVNLPRRSGDKAEMVKMEFVDKLQETSTK